jgi:hypothetical protein
MSTSLVPTVAEIQSYKLIAEVAANNPYWRKLGGGGSDNAIVATILSVMLLARELGISPMQAISGGINNIQGKFEISARIMNQLIRRHGHKLAIRLSTPEVCCIWTKRKDTGEEHEETYTIQDAAKAGLIKPTGAWKTVPSDMLFARCISRLARRVYADCIGGFYIEGELLEAITGEQVKEESLSDVKTVQKELLEQKGEIVTLLNLPDDIDEKEIDIFIDESAEESKMSREAVKARACKNMKGFISAFHVWREGKFSPVIPVELIA